MAVANIHRPSALTPTVVLSLGLGIALLVTVVEIDSNLREQFAHELPQRAPSFYFLDIPSADAQPFVEFVQARAPGAAIEDVPMLRGRIIAAGGIAWPNEIVAVFTWPPHDAQSGASPVFSKSTRIASIS